MALLKIVAWLKREWNLRKLLSSHENAHIAFTLSSQTVMGAFLLLFLGSITNIALKSSIFDKVIYRGQ